MSSFIEKLQLKSDRNLKLFEETLKVDSVSQLKDLNEQLVDSELQFNKKEKKISTTKSSREKMEYKRNVDFQVDSVIRNKMREIFDETLKEYTKSNPNFYTKIISERFETTSNIQKVKYSVNCKSSLPKLNKEIDTTEDDTFEGVIIETKSSTIDLRLSTINENLYSDFKVEIYQLIREKLDE